MIRTASLTALVVALAACGRAPHDGRGVAHDEVLVQVSATARGEARPDEALIGVGVTAVRPTAAEASAEANRILTRISQELGRLGVAADDVQTQGISLQRIDYGPERGRFRADNRVEVRLREPARAGEAIAAATEAGGNVISGPDLRVRDPERAYDTARAEAYKAARARAEAYAKAAGLKVRRVLAIQDGEIAGGRPIGAPWPVSRDAYGVEAQATAAPEQAGPPVNPGVNVRTVRVRADFALGR